LLPWRKDKACKLSGFRGHSIEKGMPLEVNFDYNGLGVHPKDANLFTSSEEQNSEQRVLKPRSQLHPRGTYIRDTNIPLRLVY
jgi:hypothetical protein